MATPILHDVKTKWPNATLTVMCQKNIASLLMGNPFIDELFSFSRPNGFLRKNFSRSIVNRIKQGNYDLGILLTNSFSSALWFWRGQVKKRLGYSMHYRKWLLNMPIDSPEEKEKEHLVITYKRILFPLGIPLSTTEPVLFIFPEEINDAHDILKRHNVSLGSTIIGINPGAAYGSAKCWPKERFQEVAKQLLKNSSTVIIFFGDKTSKELIREICEGLSSRAINLAGKTNLRELMALISICDVLLTNDSGPMHIAAALTKPLVALFGSTNSIATGPYKTGTIIQKNVPCSPCYLRTCPIDFKCMKQIEVNEVIRALNEKLK